MPCRARRSVFAESTHRGRHRRLHSLDSHVRAVEKSALWSICTTTTEPGSGCWCQHPPALQTEPVRACALLLLVCCGHSRTCCSGARSSPRVGESNSGRSCITPLWRCTVHGCCYVQYTHKSNVNACSTLANRITALLLLLWAWTA